MEAFRYIDLLIIILLVIDQLTFLGHADKHNYLEGECITIAGPSVDVQCIFPFEFNGRVYYDCALDSDGYWCSTKVDSTGSHIGEQGNWGVCGPTCFNGQYSKY